MFQRQTHPFSISTSARSRRVPAAVLTAVALTALTAIPASAIPTPERWGPEGPLDPAWERVAFHSSEPYTGSDLALLAAHKEATKHLKHLQECIGGQAGGFACQGVDLYEVVSLSTMGAAGGNDIWGWTDPTTGSEYALMGVDNGTTFVDITDPEEPVYLGKLPTHTTNSGWRDIKVYADHAFIVSEASGHGMQVFDLTQLGSVTSPPQTFSNTAHYGEFGRAHNLVINEDSGFAYAVGSSDGSDACNGGLHMIDISDPTSPTNAGCFGNDGYTHDAQCVNYVGPDVDHVGKEICLASNEDTLTLVDVTDKGNPVQLSRTGYAGAGYTHQGWLTEDQSYFLLDDEGDEGGFGHNTRTYVWDMRDLDAPLLIDRYDATTTNTDHNQYVLGDFVYQANYGAGLRILSLENVADGELTEVAFFDTSSAWSVYPYFPSGTVIVSDINLGLFVLRTQLCSDPEAPTALTATPDGDQRIELTWSGGTPETTVNVYRSFGACPGTDFELVASGVTGNSYLDTVSGQVEYSYQVSLVDASGFCISELSGCDSATTTGACTAPPLFDGIDDVVNQAEEVCALTVSWPAATANCGAGVTYSVYRDTDPDFVPAPENRVAQGLDATSWVDITVDSGESYTYVVRATDLGSGTEDGNLEKLTATATGPPADGTFSAGAEIGDPFLPSYNGSASVTSGTDTLKNHIGWEVSIARQYSGERSYFSTYSGDQCSSLSTPPLELTAGESSELSFWTVYDIEAQWDGGVVQVSTDGGESWQLLDLSPDYPGTFQSNSANACGFPGGSPSFTGTDLTWTEYTADLSAFSGQEIQIRWTFSTDAFFNLEGWYVDDVAITHAQVPGMCGATGIFFDGFESGDPGSWTNTVP